jgi:hypothetical protein
MLARTWSHAHQRRGLPMVLPPVGPNETTAPRPRTVPTPGPQGYRPLRGMADTAALSAAFESHRAHLLRVAYGTLGSVADAEDVVQEAWCGWRGWRTPTRSLTCAHG